MTGGDGALAAGAALPPWTRTVNVRSPAWVAELNTVDLAVLPPWIHATSVKSPAWAVRPNTGAPADLPQWILMSNARSLAAVVKPSTTVLGDLRPWILMSSARSLAAVARRHTVLAVAEAAPGMMTKIATSAAAVHATPMTVRSRTAVLAEAETGAALPPWIPRGNAKSPEWAAKPLAAGRDATIKTTESLMIADAAAMRIGTTNAAATIFIEFDSA